MDEDPQKSSTSSVRTTTEAFKVSIYCYYKWFAYYTITCHVDVNIVYMLY